MSVLNISLTWLVKVSMIGKGQPPQSFQEVIQQHYTEINCDRNLIKLVDNDFLIYLYEKVSNEINITTQNYFTLHALEYRKLWENEVVDYLLSKLYVTYNEL